MKFPKHRRRLPSVCRLKKPVSAARPKKKPPTTAPRFLAALKQLAPHAQYALAVSGGRDSMALVALAAAAQKNPMPPSFTSSASTMVCEKKHDRKCALWPKPADGSACRIKFCEGIHRWAQAAFSRRRANCAIGSWPAGAPKRKIPALIVAHHQRDQAETLLMRLARGSGVDGLSGMAPVQKLETAAGDLQILRPFLETDPALLAGIVRRAKFDWVEDPSNMDDQFERVRWRQAENMLDGLGLRARALARTAANMRQMRDYLEAQVTDWLQAHGGYHFCGFYSLDKAAFLSLPALLRLRVLRHVMARMGPVKFAPPETSLTHATALIAARGSGGHTLGGCMIRWRANEIMIGREVAALDALPPVPLARGGMSGIAGFLLKFVGAKKQKRVFLPRLWG